MAWAAIIGAGVSMINAHDANSGGDPAPNVSRIAYKQEERSDDMYRTYKDVYSPREKQLVNAAFDDGRSPVAEAARAGAEARAASDNANDIGLRNARRAGINPSSPAYASLMRRQQANDAGLEAAARTGGRRYANEANTANQLNVLGLGRNLPAMAGSQLNSAASLYGGVNDLRMARSAAAGELAGQGTAQLISGLSDLYKQNKTPTTTSSGLTRV